MSQRISLPYKWKPRDYQMNLWRALEGGCKRAIAVWHRRAGKGMTGMHWLTTQALQRRGLYWHLFPEYKQGRRMAWNGMDKTGNPFLSCFPSELVTRKLDQEMTLHLANGSIYQVVGTDDINSLMGANPIGLIVDEYSLQNPEAWNLLRPILNENGGWALFVYTPRGRNHGYRLYQRALKNEEWYAELLTVDDTNVVKQSDIDDDRAMGMPEPMIQQEYWSSFDAPLSGAYYAEVLMWMQENDRITDFPHVEGSRVYTGWDIGMDTTAIWFAQIVGREFRIIDYYEKPAADPAHFARVLKGQEPGYERMARYIYGDCWLPWDAKHEVFGRDLTVEEQLWGLGIPVRVGRKCAIDDQIAGVRKQLREAAIHETHCERGLNCLREYSKQKIEGITGPDGEDLYRDTPMHNWASHGASALATLVMNFVPLSDVTFRQPDASYVT
jgi:hypothetical protein